MKGVSQLETIWTKPFILLCLSMFFLCSGFYLLVPTMPLFIKELGGNESQIGIVMGLFTIAAVVVRPLVGGLLDRLGRRQFVLWGLVLFGLTMYSYAWASGVLLLMAMRVLHGVGWAMSSTAIGTAVTDNIPDSRRGEGMGWFGLSGTTAMAIGPVIGVWMLEKGSFHELFLVAAGLVAIAFFCALTVPMPFQAKAHTGRIALFDKSLVPISGSIFFLAFVYGGIVTFLPLFAASVQVNSGIFFLVYAVSLTLVRLVSGKVADRYGEASVILPGTILTILTVIILSVSGGPAGVVTAAVIFGLGFGSAQPALQAATLRLVRPDQKGLANASFTTAFDLGIGLGSIVLGWISQWSGYSALFSAAAVSGAISFVICLFVFKRSARKRDAAHQTVM